MTRKPNKFLLISRSSWAKWRQRRNTLTASYNKQNVIFQTCNKYPRRRLIFDHFYIFNSAATEPEEKHKERISTWFLTLLKSFASLIALQLKLWKGVPVQIPLELILTVDVGNIKLYLILCLIGILTPCFTCVVMLCILLYIQDKNLSQELSSLERYSTPRFQC